jgi:hypothetical protein
MSGLLFGAKVDSLKKLIQRTQPSDKMVQMLAAIQKHGIKKSCHILQQFQFLAHLLYLCTKLVYVILNKAS